MDTGTNALLRAVAQQRLKPVRLLLEGGADVNAQDESTGRTALVLACTSGYRGSSHGCDVREQVIRLLLESGADPNLRDKNGQTCLTAACRCREAPPVTVFQALLDHGADPRLEDRHGYTALKYAAEMAGGTRVLHLLADRCRALGKEVIIVTLKDGSREMDRLDLPSWKCGNKAKGKASGPLNPTGSPVPLRRPQDGEITLCVGNWAAEGDGRAADTGSDSESATSRRRNFQENRSASFDLTEAERASASRGVRKPLRRQRTALTLPSNGKTPANQGGGRKLDEKDLAGKRRPKLLDEVSRSRPALFPPLSLNRKPPVPNIGAADGPGTTEDIRCVIDPEVCNCAAVNRTTHPSPMFLRKKSKSFQVT